MSDATGQPPAATPEPGDDFARLLADAIDASGLTLQSISARLSAHGTPVSVPTLSYWQTGRKIPTRARSLRALEALDRILGLAPGRLRSALAEPNEPTGSSWLPGHLLPDAPNTNQLAEQMGVSTTALVQVVSHEDHLVLAGRHPRSLAVRRTVRALADGVRTIPVMHQQADTSGATSTVTATFGCTTGRTAHRPEQSLSITELLLPRPLGHDELHALEFEISWQDPDTTEALRRGLAWHASCLVLEVIFTDELPRRVRYAHHSSLADPPVSTAEVPVVDGIAQAVLLDPPIGIHELRWQWD